MYRHLSPAQHYVPVFFSQLFQNKHTNQFGATTLLLPPFPGLFAEPYSGLKVTSRIIWLELSWQKHSLDKMAQHPAQLNLRNAQSWAFLPHLPILTVAEGSHSESVSSCVQLGCPQDCLYLSSLKKGSLHLLGIGTL